MILDFFMQKLNKIKSVNNINGIPKLIDIYTKFVKNGFLGNLKDVLINYALQMRLSKEIADILFSSPGISLKYLDLFAKFLQGLDFRYDVSLEKLQKIIFMHTKITLYLFLLIKNMYLKITLLIIFSKTIEQHNQACILSVLNALKRNENDDLAYMVVLIKGQKEWRKLYENYAEVLVYGIFSSMAFSF
ncbi:hypothetical protein ACAG39_08265 [Caldicellulosiruptoraceae bacterium PP1]